MPRTPPLFNRGITDPDLFPELETVHGDRRKDASKLSGRRFYVVIDVAGMAPGDVRPVVEALSSCVERYVFVWTVSVYADHSIPQVEGQPVLARAEGQGPESRAERPRTGPAALLAWRRAHEDDGFGCVLLPPDDLSRMEAAEDPDELRAVVEGVILADRRAKEEIAS